MFDFGRQEHDGVPDPIAPRITHGPSFLFSGVRTFGGAARIFGGGVLPIDSCVEFLGTARQFDIAGD